MKGNYKKLRLASAPIILQKCMVSLDLDPTYKIFRKLRIRVRLFLVFVLPCNNGCICPIHNKDKNVQDVKGVALA